MCGLSEGIEGVIYQSEIRMKENKIGDFTSGRGSDTKIDRESKYWMSDRRRRESCN